MFLDVVITFTVDSFDVVSANVYPDLFIANTLIWINILIEECWHSK